MRFNSRFFSENELKCKGSGLFIMHPGMDEELDKLRTLFGRPLFVTSGCRSLEHNREIGGHPRSLHICDVPQLPGQRGCLAVDFRVQNGTEAYLLVSCAISLGWSVGVPNLSRGFIHLDKRSLIGLPNQIFGY